MASNKKAAASKTTAKKAPRAKKAPPAVQAPAIAEVATPVTETVTETVATQEVLTTTAVAVVEETPAPKQQQKPNTKRSLKKGLVGLPALLEVVKFMGGAFNALRSINCRFDRREQSGVENVRRYGVQQAKAQLSGGRPNLKQVERTIALAKSVAVAFDARFEAIMQDSFVIFEREIGEVEKIIPDIRARDGSKIVELQQGLRNVLKKDDADYDETIDAYTAMMGYLPSASAEARKIVDAERERERNKKRVEVSEALIAELESFDFGD